MRVKTLRVLNLTTFITQPTEVNMKEFKSFYKAVGGNEGSKCNYNTRLDTYGCGCSHDCKYCYAKSLLDFRNLWNPNDPSVADIEKIRKKIQKIPKGTVIRLGGMTDCFQPCEKTYRVTYETIKALNEARIEYLIVTKSAMIAEPEYLEILDKDLAHIQVTVTTFKDDLAATYEKASPPSKRVKAIEILTELGYDVALRLSPFIPSYVGIHALSSVKCKKIIVEFLRVNTWVEKWFDIDFSDYTVKQGGYRHLPLEQKLRYMHNIWAFNRGKEISVCEDEDGAYEYWKNVNPNPNDCCNLRRNNGTEQS